VRRRARHCWTKVLDGHSLDAAMQRHLAGCETCAAKIAAVRAAAHAARSSTPPPGPDVDARVLAAIGAERARPVPARARAPRRRHLRPAAFGLAVAACLLVVMAIAGPLDRVPGPSAARAVQIVPLSADCSSAVGRRATGRLLVAGVWAGDEARRFAEVLHRFEQRTGVKVTYAYETRDIAAKLKSRIKRGCAPDVALLPQPGLVQSLARDGTIEPLSERTAALARRNYSATWRRLASVDGRLYGVWFKATYKSTFWYRPGALRVAGISTPPRTWGELLEDARRLAAAGVRPFALAGASPWTLTDWFENLYLGGAGPKPYDDLAAHRIPWTDPSVTQVLRRMARVFADRRLTGSASGNLETSFEESVASVFGPRPSAAMVYEADFTRSFIPAAERDDARFFEFPGVRVGGGGGAAVVGGDVAVQFAAAPAAARLMEYLADADAAAPWARAGGFVSPNRALEARMYDDPVTRRLAALLARTPTVRFDLSDLQPPAFGATAEQGMWSIFQEFLADPSDPERTARELERAARAAWACERALEGSC
jgi:alpha-glucoside transport system substrate-binding protein